MNVDNETSRAPTATIRRVVRPALNLDKAQLRAHMIGCADRRIKDHTNHDGTLKLNQDMKPTLLPWSDAHATDVSRHRLHTGGRPDPLRLDAYGDYMEEHCGDYAMAYSRAILDFVTRGQWPLAFSMACLPFRNREDVEAYWRGR